MMDLTCTHCGKRLSKKTARQIDGVVMCGVCMFKPASQRGKPIPPDPIQG